MDVKRMDDIAVYNYGSSRVILTTRDGHYKLEGAVDGVPSQVILTWKEVEYINSNTKAIREGVVRFAEDIAEAIYKQLRILDWKDILFEEEIRDIFLNPSLEKLQKIVNIKSLTVIGRVRGQLIYMLNNGKDISTRVVKLVKTRYAELIRGRTSSDIVLTPKDSEVPITSAEVNALKSQNESMSQELAEMKELMAQLLEAQKKAAAEIKATTNAADKPVTQTVEE